jgi:hypothetical protein
VRYLAIVVFVASILCAGPEQKAKKKSATAAEETQAAALTGCIDQRGESYILASEADMSKVTVLKGKGFSNDNFARYVGHKVTVRGTQNRDVFEVTRIETLAATCSR